MSSWSHSRLATAIAAPTESTGRVRLFGCVHGGNEAYQEFASAATSGIFGRGPCSYSSEGPLGEIHQDVDLVE